MILFSCTYRLNGLLGSSPKHQCGFVNAANVIRLYNFLLAYMTDSYVVEFISAGSKDSGLALQTPRPSAVTDEIVRQHEHVEVTFTGRHFPPPFWPIGFTRFPKGRDGVDYMKNMGLNT